MIAARALGLDCGPMSGFDNAGVDREFFSGGSVKSNFLCSVGYGDPSGVFPRNPRLSFDEACNLDSNNRVTLNGNVWWIAAEEGRKVTRPASSNKFNTLVVPPKVRTNACPIADATNLRRSASSARAKQFTKGGLRRDDR